LSLDAVVLEKLFSHKIELYLEDSSELLVRLRKHFITSQKIPSRIHVGLRRGKGNNINNAIDAYRSRKNATMPAIPTNVKKQP